MNRNWAIVLLAGVFEVGWVIGLKHANNLSAWIATGIAILISMYLLLLSTRKLPVGTAYAVFTGIGTAGTVLLEMLVFHEPFRMMKVVLIIVLLIGVIGLKLVTKDQEHSEQEVR